MLEFVDEGGNFIMTANLYIFFLLQNIAIFQTVASQFVGILGCEDILF